MPSLAAMSLAKTCVFLLILTVVAQPQPIETLSFTKLVRSQNLALLEKDKFWRMHLKLSLLVWVCLCPLSSDSAMVWFLFTAAILDLEDKIWHPSYFSCSYHVLFMFQSQKSENLRVSFSSIFCPVFGWNWWLCPLTRSRQPLLVVEIFQYRSLCINLCLSRENWEFVDIWAHIASVYTVRQELCLIPCLEGSDNWRKGLDFSFFW